ncbi:hypothetical protein GYMLUDRAFT_33362 [Collybiopsis luxurians FD-317 M1]|nr:hypothetical protein GYMLUDRAFT_33362 [Collybiopsis luxurians FD-317 M1]
MVAITAEYIKTITHSYARGEFVSFIREACVPEIVFILGSGKPQHEFSGTFQGTAAVTKMVTEGLTGHEVEDGKIRAEEVKTIISGNEAFIQWNLVGLSKHDGKEFYLANGMVLTFNSEGKVTEWTDNLDTLVVAKTGGLHRISPDLKV